MQRVLVIGCGGSGKSTLARKLSEATGLPHISLDQVHWRPGWVEMPREEFREAVARLCEAPTWIMDGNYSSTHDIRMPLADTIIWLDYPRRVCISRVLWRVISGYGRVRGDMAAECPERFDWKFLKYIWNFPKAARPRIVTALEQHGGNARLHHLRSDMDANQLLASVKTCQ
jgi:adenylate kinase family enzyme